MSYERCHALEQVVVEGGLHGVLADLQQQGCQLLQADLGHRGNLQSWALSSIGPLSHSWTSARHGCQCQSKQPSLHHLEPMQAMLQQDAALSQITHLGWVSC